MFKKINIVFSMLFFLLGTNVLADSNSRTVSYESGTAITVNANGEAFVSQGQSTASEKVAGQIKTTSASTAPLQRDEANKTPFINYLLPTAVGIFIVIGIGSYWFIFRRKHI